MMVPGYWWLREIILRLFLHGESRNFVRDRLHDFWVCRQVKKYQPHILDIDFVDATTRATNKKLKNERRNHQN